MPAQPFSPPEQYALTAGLCLGFVRAAHPILGGCPTLLSTTSRRLLALHDYPLDEPLALHAFLLLPDGSAVDGEGRQSVRDLLRGFGVRRGDSYSLLPDPDMALSLAAFGQPSAQWQDYIADRLADLNWTASEIPVFSNALKKPADFRAARQSWIEQSQSMISARFNAAMDAVPPHHPSCGP